MKYTIGSTHKTNRDGDVVVVARKGKKIEVEFLQTGYRRYTCSTSLVRGNCVDHSVNREKPWEDMTEPFTANDGSTGAIFAKRGNKVLVRFDSTNHVSECFLENVRKGKLKDPYRKTFLGKGYLGDFEKVPHWRQCKQLWSNMMKRCYNPKDTKGYFGKGVTVDERWHCFANFLNDLPEIENFDAWLLGHEDGMCKYNLDKDFILKDNKVYCKELCVFLTEFENKGLGKRNKILVDGVWVNRG